MKKLLIIFALLFTSTFAQAEIVVRPYIDLWGDDKDHKQERNRGDYNRRHWESYYNSSDCDVPAEPNCLRSVYHGNSAKESCRRELDRYLNRLDKWVQCVRDESRDRKQQAKDRYQCRVHGDMFC